MAAKKTGAKKSTAKASQKAVKGEKKSGRLEPVLGVFLLFFALLLAISLFFDLTGVVGHFLKSFFRGVFGFCAYFIPILLLINGVYYIVEKNRTHRFRLWAAAMFIISLCGIISVFSIKSIESSKLSELIVKLYSHANENPASGGLLGGLLAMPLAQFLDIVGTVIVLGFFLIFSFMVYTGLTFKKIAGFIKVRLDNARADVDETFEEEYVAPKAPSAVRRSQGKKKQIDLPIDEPVAERSIKNDPDAAPLLEALGEAPEPTGYIPVSDSSAETDIPPLIAGPDPELPTEKVTVRPEETAAMVSEINKIAEKDKETATVYRYPTLSLLTKNKSVAVDATNEMRTNADKIVSALKSFGVSTKITNVSRGPSITRFELAPEPGVKISKIANLSDDLALALAATSVRIEAPIPGKAAIGIEMPNKNTTTVMIRDLLASKEFTEAKSPLTVALGKDIGGASVVADLSKMPHLLIAGATGSGKSVCINSLIISLLYKASPEKVKLIMVDPKVVELGIYNGIPHLMIPVVTDPKKASGALSWAVQEMLKRYKLFAENNVRDLNSYNKLAEFDEDLKELPQIVIIIDELADLMMAAPNEVEDSICRLAQMARAAGMHLVIATQRPSVDVITGTIKANIPSRIAFAVSSGINSRIILDQNGAEKLLGKGDMFYSPIGAMKPVRLQGCFVSDKDIDSVLSFIKEDSEAAYNDEIMKEIEKNAEAQSKGKGKEVGGASDGDEDPLFRDAVDIAVEDESHTISTSKLQRRLKLGYARAARLIDEMEERGIVGQPDGSKPRKVLLTRQEWNEIKMRSEEASL